MQGPTSVRPACQTQDIRFQLYGNVLGIVLLCLFLKCARKLMYHKRLKDVYIFYQYRQQQRLKHKYAINMY